MKRTFSIPVAATVVMLVLGLTNCKKESVPGNSNDLATTTSGQLTLSNFTAKEDRIDEIVRDLAQDSYSLSFDNPIPTVGITRTSYGAESYLAYADPQDLICGDPLRRVQKYVPIWKIPHSATITCPDMIHDPLVYQKMKEFLVKAQPAQFRGLQDIKLSNGGIFMATPSFTKQFSNLQPDRIDDITKGLNPQKFLLLSEPGGANGMFTRSFYGYANLDEYVFAPYKKKLKDIYFPKLIGCFDPETLTIIQDRFKEMSPALYKNLGVTTIPDAKNIGTLSMEY